MVPVDRNLPPDEGRGTIPAAYAGEIIGPRQDSEKLQMKMMLIAAVLITFPALSVVLYFFGRTAMLPALASLSINMLPFLVAGWILRKQSDVDAEH